jgi:hypothetical protein
MTFYGLLLTALALVAFAPFSTALPPSHEKRDETSTFFLTTATLVYKPPFSLLTEFPGLSTPAVLTLAPTLADGASSTISAPLVSYTLVPSFPARLLSFTTTATVTSTVSLNTTTVTLDRFGHAKTDTSSSSIPPQTVQPPPSQFVSTASTTTTIATGTVIFEPPLRLKTSRNILGNLATATMSPTPTELFILVTNSATLITRTTIQPTVYVKESSKTKTATSTETPSVSPDCCNDKLNAANHDLKSWQIAFAATTALFALVTTALVAKLVRLKGRFKKVEGFWAKLRGFRSKKPSTQIPPPWRPRLPAPATTPSPPQRQRTRDWQLHGGDQFVNVEMRDLRPGKR